MCDLWPPSPSFVPVCVWRCAGAGEDSDPGSWISVVQGSPAAYPYPKGCAICWALVLISKIQIGHAIPSHATNHQYMYTNFCCITHSYLINDFKGCEICWPSFSFSNNYPKIQIGNAITSHANSHQHTYLDFCCIAHSYLINDCYCCAICCSHFHLQTATENSNWQCNHIPRQQPPAYVYQFLLHRSFMLDKWLLLKSNKNFDMQ